MQTTEHRIKLVKRLPLHFFRAAWNNENEEKYEPCQRTLLKNLKERQLVNLLIKIKVLYLPLPPPPHPYLVPLMKKLNVIYLKKEILKLNVHCLGEKYNYYLASGAVGISWAPRWKTGLSAYGLSQYQHKSSLRPPL